MGAANNALVHCSSLLLPLFLVCCHTPGIILKRQAKPTGGDASRRKPSDLASLADSVQKLCQVALPLARSLEFLQEDVDSMSKEYRCVCVCECVRPSQDRRLAQAVHTLCLRTPRFWVTERRVFQERLQEEQKAAADTCNLAAAVAEQDNAIRGARARVLALRSQVRVVACWGLGGSTLHTRGSARACH